MEFNTIGFSFFDIPPYFFCAVVGFVFSISCYMFILLKMELNLKENLKILYLSIPGIFIGSKLFGIIKNIIDVIHNNLVMNKNVFLQSGIVFYGGLIFFLFSYYCLLKQRNKRELITNAEYHKMMDCVAVVIPLFHAFGRIGCFTAGCCYGIENHSYVKIIYTNYINGVITTKERIPIQLIESGCNFIIFVVLFFMLHKRLFSNQLLNIYLIVYPIIRFIIEFFRGDWNRYVALGLSMSQYISIILFALNIWQIIKVKGRNAND